MLLEVVPPMIWIYQAVHFMAVLSIYTKNSDLRDSKKKLNLYDILKYF